MKLYHYSKDFFIPVLKTPEALKIPSQKELEEAKAKRKSFFNIPPGTQYQCLPFFFDKFKETDHQYFHPNHGYWNKNSELLECVVEVDTFKKFEWMILETPEVIEATKGLDIKSKEYWDVYKTGVGKKYIGRDLASFEKIAKMFIGKTRPFIERSFEDKDPSQAFDYAPGVPHVAIFTRKAIDYTYR